MIPGRVFLLTACLVITSYVHPGHSKRILAVFPPAFSVISPLLPALKELYSKYGHQTTVIMNEGLASRFKNETFNIIISENLNTFSFNTLIEDIIDASLKGKSFTAMRSAFGGFSEICDLLLSDEKLYKELEKTKFDLAITWKNPMGFCFGILPYKLSIPFVVYGNGFDPLIDRIPFSSSFVPNQAMQFSDKMSFSERLINTVVFSFEFFMPDMVTPYNALQKYVPGKPPISTTELVRRAELHLMEADPLLDFPRPVFPHYVFIGGMGTGPARNLDGDLKMFMNSANQGAVVVSFGSLLTGFPDEVIQTLLKSFRKFKEIKFVFRYGDDATYKENIYLLPWIPQNDLLGHANTKLFITHCGNAGQFEALYHGVPMLGIPVNGDQFNNAKRMESKGFGTILKLTEVTVEDVIWHIDYLLNNKQIQQNIKTAAKIYKTRPDSSKERAAFWIDHVLQYGGQYMRPAHLDMPFYQYILLDVMFVIVFVLVLSFSVIVFVLRKLYRLCCRRKIKTE